MVTNAPFNMPVTFNCWDLIKDLSVDAKRSLIVALQNSLDEKECDSVSLKNDDEVVDFLSQQWPEDGMSADDFVSVCESGRSDSRSIVEI